MNNVRCAQCHAVMSIRQVRVVKDNHQFCSGICYRRHFNIPTYTERRHHASRPTDSPRATHAHREHG